MCTVTYFPTTTGCILTHNRDECPSRSPQALTQEKNGSETIIYPKDQQAHGSWIFINSSGFSACLLNGAFQNHIKKDSYKMSRGQVLLSLGRSSKPADWMKSQSLENIEPFTMIICQKKELTEMIWDGNKKHIHPLDYDTPAIWSSATLYSLEIKKARESIFYNWVENIKEVDPAAWMKRFHEKGSVGDIENNIHMFRKDGPRTISTTQIISTNEINKLIYYDVLNEYTEEAIIQYKKTSSKNALSASL